MAEDIKKFKEASSQVDLSKLEEETISYWKEKKIFEKSISSRPENKTWTFLDGPPFITGLPHYGSLLSSIPKDLFPRYFTMKGYRVRRVWGWDGHGLPAENKVETQLGLKSKKEIENKVGISKFIEECKKYVNGVSSEWGWYIDHIARWAEYEHAYRTWDLPYMETVMWVFKQMYEKGHIYKGLRVSLYCPHCSTPISNFEVAMDADNYKEISEPTAVFKYQLEGEVDTYLLAWSTTPWNKIATPALAVNPKLRYVKVEQGTEKYILAKNTVKILLDDKPHKVLKEFAGSELVGLKFIPHYKFYSIDPGKRAFVVMPGDFVTEEEGTGVVTIAAYGEEDLAVMQKENIQIVLHVDDEGKLKKEVPNWAGMYYLDVDPLVIEDLKNRSLVYRVDSYSHTVPTCWRCHTRLLYAPQDAWYVNVQQLKPQMVKTNEAVNWFPGHFKYGRYLKSLESAPDWCISRSRYWGSPVPVWECECGERFVPGSISELEKVSGRKVNELHKPDIDEITVKCQKCGKTAHRVPEVLDSWIEAGSASLAERHFPFDKTQKLEQFFPPDFIVEYTGQIRAWFYILHVISTALYGSNAFKNVMVTGVILGTDGRKMSKNYGNYPDPKEMIQKYGGDALRLYLMGSPVMRAEDMRISEEKYRDQVRGFLLLIWNVHNFFVTYANADKWQPKSDDRLQMLDVRNEKLSVLDKWIFARLYGMRDSVTDYLEKYDTVSAIRELESFVLDLSQWYVRRSRDRIGPVNDSNPEDKAVCYEVLYTVLTTFSKILAPFIPFMSEQIYRNLTGEESVHLTDWPFDSAQGKPEEMQNLLEEMRVVRKICELGHAEREKSGIKVRQPLAKLQITNCKLKLSDELMQLIKDELNIKEITIKEGEGELEVILDKNITPELQKEGFEREIVRSIQGLRQKAGLKPSQFASAMFYGDNGAVAFVTELKSRLDTRTQTKLEQAKEEQKESVQIKLGDLGNLFILLSKTSE